MISKVVLMQVFPAEKYMVFVDERGRDTHVDIRGVEETSYYHAFPSPLPIPPHFLVTPPTSLHY